MGVMPTALAGDGAPRPSLRCRAGIFPVLMLFLSACTGGEVSEGPTPLPDANPRVAGVVVVTQRFGGELATIELPDGEPEPLSMPEDVRFVHAAYVIGDGSVLAVIERDHERIQVYTLGTASDPVAIGPPLRRAHSFALAAGRLLAARCDRAKSAWILDLELPERWIPAPGGCGATLSPEGTVVAWSPDGRRVVQASTDPSAPVEPVLDAAGLDGLPPGMRRLEVIGRLSWGPGGLAVPLGNNERQAAAVVEEDGTVAVTPLGDRGAGIGASLAWQPSGGFLAVASWGTLEAIVRVFPPNGESRVVAMDADPIAGLLWSPGGEVLLAASQSRWTFVTAGGEWVRSTPVPRGELVPIGWSA